MRPGRRSRKARRAARIACVIPVVLVWAGLAVHDAGTVAAAPCRPTSGEQVARDTLSGTEEILSRVFSREVVRLKRDGVRLEADWKQAVFMLGAMRVFEATSRGEYRDAALEWADATGWAPGPRSRHADDQSPIQVYLALVEAGGPGVSDDALEAARASFDAMVADPASGREEWSWCDALFMAPPAMAGLSRVSGASEYAELMDRMWWDTHELLYDPEERLYYRDERAKTSMDGSVPRSFRGNKLMWARGNGWVLAGTAAVLAQMPADLETRPRYERLFVEMAGRVAELQGEGGLWGSSLLDPMDRQPPESSASALFCAALAWGVGDGLLDGDAYLPVVRSAWEGLAAAVDEDGRLGWVQRPARRPGTVLESESWIYGSGAFLMAGAEVLELERSGLLTGGPSTRGEEEED